MNNKKWVVVFACVLLVAGAATIKQLISEGQIRAGFPNSDFITLKNGTYAFDKLDLEVSAYAIYAITGVGVLSIDGQDYKLDSSLFEDVKQRGGVAVYGILYEASPKISLVAESVIVVSGDENFKVSFLKK